MLFNIDFIFKVRKVCSYMSDRYECPECGKSSMAQEGKFFKCFSVGCELHLSINEYLPIAAAILRKPLDLTTQSLNEYKLPKAVVDNILKVLYSIEQVKKEKLEVLSKKGITQDYLRNLNNNNGLTLLLDKI